jgi:hypothetical protein
MGNNKPEIENDRERSSKLPDEIISAEQCRSDYLKWKLLLVAGLGAAGFGLGECATPRPLLLALIPFVCMYVDLLCINLKLRTLVIGTFYAKRNDHYETFVSDNRTVFVMEDWALYWSTYAICLILILIGSSSQTPALCWRWPAGENLILVLAGSVGIVLSFIIHLRSNTFRKQIVEKSLPKE